MVHVCPGMQYKTCNPRHEVPALIYGATEGHELGAITYKRRQLCMVCGMQGEGWPSAATAWGFYRHSTRWPHHQLGSLPFSTRLLPLAPLRIVSFKKKKRKKGFGHPVTTIRGTGRLLTWRSGPRERPRPRPPAGQAQPPPKTHSVGRGDRSGAHARGGAAPRASHFRRAGRSAVPGRCSSRRPAVGAGDARGVRGRPGRRGSAGCPQSGRCAGGGRRREQVPHSFSGLGLPPKRPGRGWPNTQGGGRYRGAERARVGTEAGCPAWESGA